MKKIILINGKKRSGKDTTAEMLQEVLLKQNKTVKVLAFADKLKDMVCEMFNITRADLEEYKNENVPINLPDEWWGYELTDFRTFLDTFGNKIAKNLGGDSVWADKVLELIENSDEEYFIISDFRFPIEINVFEDYNYEWYTNNSDDLGNFIEKEIPFKLITLQVQRKGLPFSDLPSENALNDFVFDYTIENNSSLENLKENVGKLSGEILNKDKKDKEK